MKTLALLLAAAMLLGFAPSLHAQTSVTVTTTADSGPGSLRQTIAMPSAVITQNYFYQIPEAAPDHQPQGHQLQRDRPAPRTEV